MSATSVETARLMTHLVSHFPNRNASLEIARGLAEGGAAYLEIQFPFSDPFADGSLIQTACGMALEGGFSVDGGFDLAAEIASSTGVPTFIMSYGNLVFRRGVARFVERARSAGVTGLIIPDLMPGSDEGLYAAGRDMGVHIVPVVAPSIGDERLKAVAGVHPEFVYAALRVGITGSYTEIGADNHGFLARLRGVGPRILAGFGISSPEQVEALAGEVHALVVGSALVRTILDAVDRGEEGSLRKLVGAQTRSLLGVSDEP